MQTTLFSPDKPIVLILHGAVPGGKNGKQISRAKGRVFLRGSDSWIQAKQHLTFQTQAQWRGRPPMEHPEMSFKFYLANAGSDRDNKYTFLLDVLQDAGVIVNDNFKRFNGKQVILPGEIVKKGEERTEITIYPQGAL